MSNHKSLLPLVAVIGPTASGKSTLAVWLARQLGGEVVACDSTQLYRGVDIGTAKPDPAERQGIAHHLLNVLAPNEEATAGGYREMALAILEDLRKRQRLPVFTVGTGLYLRALIEGLSDVPQRSEELRQKLRASAERHAPGHLHRLVRRLDPATSTKIAPADEQKLIRAIEVCLIAKRPLSKVHETGRTPLEGWRVLKIGLMPQREALYERIHARTDEMLARGWMNEVCVLLNSGLPEDAKPFDFIGYREMRAVVRGEMKLEDARGLIQQATRRYAKRQLTWFRKELDVWWYEGFGDDPLVQGCALEWLQRQGIGASRSAEVRGV